MTRRPNNVLRERVVIPIDHPSVSATTALKFFKATGAFRVSSVKYINPTGLAEDPDNTFAGAIKNGATVVATLFDTDSDNPPESDSLPADTWVDGALSATDANLVLAPGDTLSLVLTKGGTQTLPAGRAVVEGFYL